jgi:fluoroquinolone transport system permease protein
VAGLWAPLLAIVLATAAEQGSGFRRHEGSELGQPPADASFFVPLPIQFAAGVIPSYWPMRALWSAAAGDGFAMPLAFGAVIGVLTIGLAAALFDRRLLRRG